MWGYARALPTSAARGCPSEELAVPEEGSGGGTLTERSLTRRMLCGLRSPWSTLVRCMNLSASAMSSEVSSTHRSMSIVPAQRPLDTASARVRVGCPGRAR